MEKRHSLRQLQCGKNVANKRKQLALRPLVVALAGLFSSPAFAALAEEPYIGHPTGKLAPQAQCEQAAQSAQAKAECKLSDQARAQLAADAAYD